MTKNETVKYLIFMKGTPKISLILFDKFYANLNKCCNTLIIKVLRFVFLKASLLAFFYFFKNIPLFLPEILIFNKVKLSTAGQKNAGSNPHPALCNTFTETFYCVIILLKSSVGSVYLCEDSAP